MRTIDDIFEELSAEDKAAVITACLLASTCGSKTEFDSAMKKLSDRQRKATAEILTIKVNESFIAEKAEKKKRDGEKIRQTAELLLQTMLRHWPPQSNDAELCDRAIRMAQQLHDAT